MMKIGEDGVKTFQDLEWNFYAKASDVLAACKTEAGLKAFVNNVIADAGIATNDAMEALAGRVTTAEGKITTLEGEMDAVEKKAADNETAIGVLNGDASTAGSVAKAIADALAAYSTTEQMNAAIGTAKDAAIKHADDLDKAMDERVDVLEAAIAADGAVDTKIKNAIDALDVTDTAVVGKYVSAVNEVDGKVVITRADLPDYTEVYDAKGDAAQALIDAKAYADAEDAKIESRVDALEAIDHSHTFVESELNKIADGDVAKWNAAEQNAKDYTDAEIKEWVGEKTVGTQITEAITGLDLANTYDAKGAAAAAETAAKGHADGLNTAMNTRVEALEAIDHDHANKAELDKIVEGDKAKWDATEQNAKDYADDLDEAMDGRVAALEAKFGDGEGNVESQIAAAVAAEAKLREEADNGLAADIKAITDDYLKAADKTELADDIKANTDAIDALKELVGETDVEEQISSAIDDALKVEVDGAKVEKYALATALAEEAETARAAEKANADAIALLNNNAETAGSVDYKIAQAVAAIMENPDDTMNSINELVTWINGHAEDALEMSNQVAANKTAIETLNGDATKAGSVDKKIADAIAAENLSQYATDGELTAVDNRLKDVEAAVGAEGSVAKAIEEAVDEANGYTDGEIAKLTAEGGAVKANADAIDALEGLVGTESVESQINTAINTLKAGQLTTMQGEIDAAEGRLDDLEADTHTHANKAELDKFVDGDKAKLDAAVQTVTAGTGLTATKTGTDVAIAFYDAVTFIFDCGTSAE